MVDQLGRAGDVGARHTEVMAACLFPLGSAVRLRMPDTDSSIADKQAQALAHLASANAAIQSAQQWYGIAMVIMMGSCAYWQFSKRGRR
jgi:hypothetical protein